MGLRVVGCLIEKQRTTPDAYPLSLNALRAACNQSTNRDPVVAYDEPTIRAALERLSRLGWVRLASGPGSRAAKYRHLLDDALGLSGKELALLAVLMLRGPQTLGELNQRTERLSRFGSLAEIEQTLDAMAARELVARLPRRPGQKEERYAHLLGEEEPAGAGRACAAAGRGRRDRRTRGGPAGAPATSLGGGRPARLAAPAARAARGVAQVRRRGLRGTTRAPAGRTAHGLPRSRARCGRSAPSPRRPWDGLAEPRSARRRGCGSGAGRP